MMILQQTRGILSSGDGLALDLPFAETKSLTALVGPTPTFTRASTATFVGSDGLIQTAAVNAPRFDHDPVTLASRGLLIEEGRTNLITGSDAFNTWTTANCTVAASSVANPEGSLSAWKVVEDSSLASHNITRLFTPVSETTYTVSVWVKSAENGFAFLGLAGGGFPVTFISVNISTGAVSTTVGTPIGATSVSHSNGWWRVSFSLAATASLASTFNIRLSRDGNWANRSYLGNGVNGIYVYGAQLEAGAFPTSYIPTTTSALARSADACSITGANFTSFYNQSEGTMYIEADPSRMPASLNGNRVIVGFSSGTYTSQVMLIAKASSFDSIQTCINNAFATAVNNLNPFRAAIAVRTGSNSSALGGVINANTTSSILAADRLQFRDPTGVPGGHPTCTIATLRYYKKRLPNAKLQALTA